jgi:hypothetical protein
MADINVKSYIDELRKALPYVPPVPVQQIEELHRKREFGRVVRLIRETMNIGVNLTLHWTSEGDQTRRRGSRFLAECRITALQNSKTSRWTFSS